MTILFATRVIVQAIFTLCFKTDCVASSNNSHKFRPKSILLAERAVINSHILYWYLLRDSRNRK